MQSRSILNHIAMSNSVRRLWADSSQWLRLMVYSIYHDMGDRTPLEVRLNKTGDTIGAFFAQYYGEETGEKIQKNYQAHIHTLGEMIAAYRAGDGAAISSAREALYRGSDELAGLYADINRFWDKAGIQAHLYAMVNAMENEIASVASGDFAREIEAHDHLMSQAYGFSDVLTAGLLRQLQLS